MALLMFVCVNSCSDDTYCASLEREIVDRCINVDSVYSIKLASLTQFDWDTVYVIAGPRFPEEVSEITGLDYDEVLQDDHNLYLFIKDGKIAEELISSCRYRRMLIDDTHGTGFVTYPNSAIVQIKKQINEGGEYYKLVGAK